MFNRYMAVGIRVSDFKRAFDFYTKVLKLKVKTEDRKNQFAELKLGELVIALLTDETLDGMCGRDKFAGTGKSDHLFAVEVDDVRDTVKKLSNMGIEFVARPKTTPWGQQVVYFKDVEGYIWEISEKFAE